jgi:glutaredoxin-dependent peroxiredoxin
MTLRIGQRVPDFSLPDANKQERKLSEFTRKGKTVLLFFPFAFSGVCDKEMCVFRDESTKTSSFNAQMVGVSVDSVFTLKVFAQTYNLQFPLLSDFNKKVSRAYGVIHETWPALGYKGVSKRATFVLDDKGILRYKWVTDMPSDEPPYDEITSTLARV